MSPATYLLAVRPSLAASRFGGLPGAAIGSAIGHGLASVGVWAFDWWQPKTPAVGLVGTMIAEERDAYLDYVLRKYGDTSK